MNQVDWDNFKKNFIDEWSQGGYNFGKVVFTRNGENDAGVSEGMGYGMLMAVQNGDQQTFDKMVAFLEHSGMLDSKGLLNWMYDNTGVTGEGSATDADQDIAYALLLAHQKWGSSSSFDYLGIAQKMIQAIYGNEIDTSDPNHPILRPGDHWGQGGNQYFNPSYVDPAEWAAFAKADPQHADVWNALIQSSLDTLMDGADPKTGLIANWPHQAPPGYNNPNAYGYDSCRVPMRLAQYYEYLHNQPSLTDAEKTQMVKIQSLLNRQLAFFFQHQAPGGGIYSGYSLDGSTNVGYGNEACFNGPVMDALSVLLKCGGIDGSGLSQEEAQSFLDSMKTLVAKETHDSLAGGPTSSSSNYFNGSLGLLNEGWEDFQPESR